MDQYNWIEEAPEATGSARSDSREEAVRYRNTDTVGSCISMSPVRYTPANRLGTLYLERPASVTG